VPVPPDDKARIEGLAAAMVATSGLSYREVAKALTEETGHEINHVFVARAVAKVKKQTEGQAKGNKPGRHPTNFRPKAPDDGTVAVEVVHADENERRRIAFLENCFGLGNDSVDMLRALARMVTRAAEQNRNPQLLVGIAEVVADRTIRIISVVLPLVNGEAPPEEAADDQP
jgi:hypothetical protein